MNNFTTFDRQSRKMKHLIIAGKSVSNQKFPWTTEISANSCTEKSKWQGEFSWIRTQ